MSNLATFVWSIADQLRGPFKPNEYGDVILPMTILRRLDCVLADDRETVWNLAAQGHSDEMLAALVRKQTGRSFWNSSKWTFSRLVGDPDGLETNLQAFISGFSANIDVFEHFEFSKAVRRMADNNRLMLVVQKFADLDLHPSRPPSERRCTNGFGSTRQVEPSCTAPFARPGPIVSVPMGRRDPQSAFHGSR